MSCWNKKVGSIVALEGHRKALLNQFQASKRAGLKDCSISDLELRLKNQTLEREKDRAAAMVWNEIRRRPNVLTVIEMVVLFFLICREKSKEIGQVIPAADLVRLVLPYLYPDVSNFLNGRNIITTFGLSNKYFPNETPYYCPYQLEFGIRVPKHNFIKLYYKIIEYSKSKLEIMFRPNLNDTYYSYIIKIDVTPTNIKQFMSTVSNFSQFKVRFQHLLKHQDEFKRLYDYNCFKLKQLYAVIRRLYYL